MRLIAFLIAVAGGFLLNVVLLPDVSIPNQIVAVLGWGLVLCAMPAPALDAVTIRTAAPLLLAIGLAFLACAASMAFGGMPRTPGLPQLGLLAMAAVLAVHGAGMAGASQAAFRPFAIALVVAGALGAVIGTLQIFAPSVLDNHLAAFLVHPGRAVGNLGQPNQFADTQVWGLLALVALAPSPAAPRARASRVLLALLGLLLVLGLVLSGSRVGLLGVGVMAIWALVDPRLPRATRIAMVASLVVACACHWLLTSGGHAVLDQRTGSDFSSSRDVIWRDLLTLIGQQPLLGVGWGQLNFAWTLTPLPLRHSGFLDNAHDLPLQLAVELGIPLATVILGMLLWALWKALRAVGRSGIEARCALALVVVMGVHSLLEFPLWFAYFLLPTAWAWGQALGARARATAPSPDIEAALPAHRSWRIVGALFVAVGVAAWFDYGTIAALYMPGPATASLDDRLGRAQVSPLFRHHGEYALALQAQRPADVLPEIDRAAHAYIDGRLLYAWANALEHTGQDDKARYVAARLREFRLPGAAAFFAPCDDPAVAVKPFQCLPASPGLTWHDFR